MARVRARAMAVIRAGARATVRAREMAKFRTRAMARVRANQSLVNKHFPPILASYSRSYSLFHKQLN